MISHAGTDLLIIGGGPAGYTAAIYSARAGRAPILIEGPQPGGQLTITSEVENYPGFAAMIQGPWLMDQMRMQAAAVGASIVSDVVLSVDLSSSPFAVTCGQTRYSARAITFATGASARWLGVPGEERLRGFGVSGCAVCDAPFFEGATVAVIGGGNTAVEEALYLAHHAAKVVLIHRRDRLRADSVLQRRLLGHSRIEVLWNSVVEEVLGDTAPMRVTGVRVRDRVTNADRRLHLEGVFVAIGHTPATSLVVGQVALDEHGYIAVAGGSTVTSVPGVFAAGDVADSIYRQAVTAAGMGCMAALDAERWLNQEAGRTLPVS